MLDQRHTARSSPGWTMAELGRGQEEHIKTRRLAYPVLALLVKGSVSVLGAR
jgi:hypothetical protein